MAGEAYSVDVKEGLEIQKMENYCVQWNCKGLVGDVENGELQSKMELWKMGWKLRKWRTIENNGVVKDGLEMQKMEKSRVWSCGRWVES